MSTAQDINYDDLVTEIYRAASGLTSWHEALDAIARALDCWSGHLMGFSRSTGAIVFDHDGGSPPPEASLDYIRVWHRLDPRNAVLLKAPPGHWIHCHEHLDDAFVANDPFYRDFLIPYGARYVSGIHFEAGPDLICIFSFQRGVGRKPFDMEEREMLDRLRRHVTTAFQIQLRSRQALRQAFAGHAILQRIRYPVFLLDEHRTLIFANQAAEDLMRGSKAMSRQGDRLTLTDLESERRLTAVLASLALSASEELHAEAPPPIVCVPGNSGAPAVVHSALMRPEETMGAFGNIPLFLVSVFDIGTAPTLDPFIVSTAFGLSPAEARIAVAAAAGHSDERIATQAELSVFTVRTHLRRVFQKMRVARRAQLVRLLNQSPAFWS